MAKLMSRSFWAAASARAVKTLAQTALACMTTDQTGLTNFHWGAISIASGVAALMSVLTSVASLDDITAAPAPAVKPLADASEVPSA